MSSMILLQNAETIRWFEYKKINNNNPIVVNHFIVVNISHHLYVACEVEWLLLVSVCVDAVYGSLKFHQCLKSVL